MNIQQLLFNNNLIIEFDGAKTKYNKFYGILKLKIYPDRFEITVQKSQQDFLNHVTRTYTSSPFDVFYTEKNNTLYVKAKMETINIEHFK